MAFQQLPLPPVPKDLPEPSLSANALTVLQRRYLIKDRDGRVVETPRQMFWRVAWNVAQAEALHDPHADVTATAREFYEAMARLEFLPNSPTLMNAGREHQQLSACFVLPVEDSLEAIFDTIKHTAIIHRTGGGTGFSFSRLRPKDDRVASTGGVASGPVSFLRVFNAATDVIKQGGCVHPDTLIATEQGMVPIKALGDAARPGWQEARLRIPTDDGIRFVDGFYNNGVQPVITLRTERGFTFTATHNHTVRIMDDEGRYLWKRLDAIRPGDWVVLLKNTFMDNEVAFPALHIGEGADHHRRFPQTLTQDLAELAGYQAGAAAHPDLSAHDLRKDGLSFPVRPDQDAHIPARLMTQLQQLFGGSVGVEDHGDDLIRIIAKDAPLAAWWPAMGLAVGPEGEVPGAILRSSRDLVFAFFRGLFEAAGEVDAQGVPRVRLQPRRLAQELQVLLLAVGMPSQVAGAESEWTLSLPTLEARQLFATHIGFLSRCKQQALPSLPNGVPRRTTDQAHRHLDRFFDHPDLPRRHPLYQHLAGYLTGAGMDRHLPRPQATAVLDEFDTLAHAFLTRMEADNRHYEQVADITRGRSLTLDLSVEVNHTYIANAFVSHNTRRGANMAILNVNHPDILDFIAIKDTPGELTNFNLSVGVTDAFMRAVEQDEEYDLVHPGTGLPVKRLWARAVFDHIVEKAWRSGEPGVVFLDRINRDNPTPGLGAIESTNPCGEQPLLPNESCNLGSINLAACVTKDRTVDYGKLNRMVHIGVRFLDDVIDMNKYPLPAIEAVTKANRKIGLGVMGFADLLIQMGIPYGDPKALDVAEEIMHFVQQQGRAVSADLAQERGPFPNFSGSKYDAPGSRPLRNATVTTVAPTGTLSIIANCSGGIEPLFAISYVRRILDDDRLTEVHPLFEATAKARGFYSPALMEAIASQGGIQRLEEIPAEVRRVYLTSFDIPPEQHVAIQGVFQRFADAAVSKTINFPPNATVEDVRAAYLQAYRLGCKGITVYRYGSRGTQVLNLEETGGTDGLEGRAGASSAARPAAGRPPAPVDGLTVMPRIDAGTTRAKGLAANTRLYDYYATVNGAAVDFHELSAAMRPSADGGAEVEGRMTAVSCRRGEPGLCPDCLQPTQHTESCFTCQSCGYSLCG